MATLGELFAENAVWHAAGNGVLSVQSKDATLSWRTSESWGHAPTAASR
ncbi:hypothetical protein [Pseudarthrobacter sp. S9]